MLLQKDEVIVLKQNRFSESDLIVKVLNPKGALLSFIAKGALKSKKRFTGGVLEPGNFIGVEYRKSRRSALHFLCQAWPLKRFEGLRTSYDQVQLAFHFLSLIEKVGQEGEEDSPHLFNLLGNTLSALEKSRYLPALQFLFELRLLCLQGVLPKELHHQKALLSLTVQEHEKLISLGFSFKDISPMVQTALEHYIEGRH